MYTHAAQSIGARTFHILRRHIVPNVMPVLIVLFTTRIGAVILTEAGLSFLGLGVPPPGAYLGQYAERHWDAPTCTSARGWPSRPGSA